MISKTKSKDIDSLIIKVKNMAKKLMKKKSGNKTLQYTDLDRRQKILIGGNNVKVKLDNETKEQITEELKTIGYLVHLLKASTVQKIYQKIIDTKKTDITDEDYFQFRSGGIELVKKLTPEKKGIYNFKIFVDEGEDKENLYNKYGVEKEITVLNLVMLFYNYLAMETDDQDDKIDKKSYQNTIEEYYVPFNFNFEQKGISESVEGLKKQRDDDTDIEIFESRIYEINILKEKCFEEYYRIKKEEEEEEIKQERITKIIENTHKAIYKKYREFLIRIKNYEAYNNDRRVYYNATEYIQIDHFGNDGKKVSIRKSIMDEIEDPLSWIKYSNEEEYEGDEKIENTMQANALKKINSHLDKINKSFTQYEYEIDNLKRSKIVDTIKLESKINNFEKIIETELQKLLIFCGTRDILYRISQNAVEDVKQKARDEKEHQESIDQATETRRQIYSSYGRHGYKKKDDEDKIYDRFIGGAPTKYKSTGQVVYIVYKNKKYKRSIYMKEKGKTKYCKMNNEYILLSKCKVIV